MPQKRTRAKLARQVNNVAVGLTPEVIANRTKRHLDELERSNYAEQSGLNIGGDDGEDGGGKYTKGRARQTISDKRTLKIPGPSPAATKKKSTMNIRTALLYRKNLATLIDESGIAGLPVSYLTAQTSPSTYPPRLICSVCGYWGSYKCRRCAVVYCSLNCEAVHNETRCERRVL